MEIIKNKIKRFVSGKFSVSDLLSVEKYFREHNFDDSLRNHLQEDWNTTNKIASKSLGHVLDKIHHKIALNRPVKINPLRNLYRGFSRIAAILIIPLLIYLAWDFQDKHLIEGQVEYAELVSRTGVITSIKLPDGSKVWLNNFTKLRYPLDFSESREVYVDGEAYFEVAHRNNDCFIVKTEDLSVEVLGTKFNVIAYKEDQKVSVVLSEGKVKVMNDAGSISETLKPNEKFSLDKLARTATLENVISEDYFAWRGGYLKFREEPLSEVVKKMERWYNVDIEILSDDLKIRNYRGTFKNEPIEEVLRLMALTTPMKYTINEREITDDNGYEKKKITIERR